MSETSPGTDPTTTATRDIADVAAVEVITTAAVHLMSAAAVKCGLAEDGPTGAGADFLDLDEARKLITALAALVTASAPDIGNQHARSLRDGLRSLQLAFREASPVPRRPGRRARARSSPARSSDDPLACAARLLSWADAARRAAPARRPAPRRGAAGDGGHPREPAGARPWSRALVPRRAARPDGRPAAGPPARTACRHGRPRRPARRHPRRRGARPGAHAHDERGVAGLDAGVGDARALDRRGARGVAGRPRRDPGGARRHQRAAGHGAGADHPAGRREGAARRHQRVAAAARRLPVARVAGGRPGGHRAGQLRGRPAAAHRLPAELRPVRPGRPRAVHDRRADACAPRRPTPTRRCSASSSGEPARRPSAVVVALARS